ncbi:hypothetical protein NJ76_29080 [Rhodococcus sp. IITR03]|nr:hypothetical protein NJ76_29080 [Rhodococcus sp. IITR03]
MGPKRGRTNHQRHLRAVLDRRSGVTAASVADRTEAASVGTPHEWAPILPDSLRTYPLVLEERGLRIDPKALRIVHERGADIRRDAREA